MEPYEYKDLIPFIYQLDHTYWVDLSDPRKFPELYLAKNCFDIGHYNNRGAEIFTKYLAKEINNIIE